MSKKEKLKAIIFEAFENTDGHALPGIYRSEYKFVKVILFIAWLAGAGATIYLLTLSVMDYLQYGVISQTSTIQERSMAFPVITVCRMDPFVTDESIAFLAYVIQKNYPLGGTNTYNTTETELENVNNFVQNVDNFESVALFEAQRNNSRKLLGFKREIFIQSCNWDNKVCNVTSDFQHTWDFKRGNCYSFNQEKITPRNSSMPGIDFI